MKVLASMLFVILMAIPTGAFAQSEAQPSSVAADPSGARDGFATMKTLAGEWEGVVSVQEMPEMTTRLNVSIRVTSRGNAILHEFQEAGTPLDATLYDHPITMFYVDQEQLTLVHYCDAGNRPRMNGTMSPDGKTIAFEFADISGSMEYHMHNAVFNIVDADHHTEDWTFMMGDKPMHAHFDLVRTSTTPKYFSYTPSGEEAGS
ncbi:MAG TPA: hypothetical protein VJ982_12090 [Gemmatimonadota bacterium]|nr:hypothetical protein [Gemmatimonadota bacterium]